MSYLRICSLFHLMTYRLVYKTLFCLSFKTQYIHIIISFLVFATSLTLLTLLDLSPLLALSRTVYLDVVIFLHFFVNDPLVPISLYALGRLSSHFYRLIWSHFWLLHARRTSRRCVQRFLRVHTRSRKTLHRRQYLQLVQLLLHLEPALPRRLCLQWWLALQHIVSDNATQTRKILRR